MKSHIIAAAAACFFTMAHAQVTRLDFNNAPVPAYESVCDSVLQCVDADEQLMSLRPLPRITFQPIVYTNKSYLDTLRRPVFAPDYSGVEALRWIEDELSASRRSNEMIRAVIFTRPDLVRYNTATMPPIEPIYEVVIDPVDFSVSVEPLPTQPADKGKMEGTKVKKVHWLNKFNASLQFTQAYVSPNWYQGGNSNVNALLNLYYNIKLNPAYHPNLLFETTAQYKLGINSAPEDTIREYNVSEDIFQINTVFGLRAAKKWYYSVTGQFKTQMVNSYKANSEVLRSAFLSPAELNVGIGMTYNTANKSKTFTFDASIAPLSYNLKICTNDDMNPANYGIDPGKHSVSKYGSSAECKIGWKLAGNITFRSRIFAFTDYSRAYADWENAFIFSINRFLTTNLDVNLRYDTNTPKVDKTEWKKLQLKQLLSIGFAYTFETK